MLAIGVLLMWLSFRNVDLNEAWIKIKNAHWIWVWASVLCSVVAYASRAYRWNMLIKPTNHQPKLINSFYAVCVAYFANLAIPRIGEVTRCTVLSKKEKIPFDILLGTVIVERVVDALTLLLIMVILLVMEFDTMFDFLNENVFSKFNVSLSMPMIIIAVIVIAAFIIGGWMFFKSQKFASLNKKVIGFLSGIAEGLKSVMQMKNKGLFIFHSVFIWFMYFLMVYLGFNAMDATASLGLREGVFVLVAGGLGMSAPVQGGIGAYHLLVSKGLLLFGVAYDNGIAFATLMHTSQLVQIVVLGLIALLALFLSPDRDAKVDQTNAE